MFSSILRDLIKHKNIRDKLEITQKCKIKYERPVKIVWLCQRMSIGASIMNIDCLEVTRTSKDMGRAKKICTKTVKMALNWLVNW